MNDRSGGGDRLVIDDAATVERWELNEADSARVFRALHEHEEKPGLRALLAETSHRPHS